MIIQDGPRGYLNDNADGPFAFANASAVQQFNNTRWLYEYALDAVEEHGDSWSEFGSGLKIASIYAIIAVDEETGETSEFHLDADDLGEKGIAILDAATRGEDVEPAFNAWMDELYGS